MKILNASNRNRVYTLLDGSSLRLLPQEEKSVEDANITDTIKSDLEKKFLESITEVVEQKPQIKKSKEE